MKDEDIEALLQDLRDEQLPPAPDMRRAVRTEIRRIRERPATWRRFVPDFDFGHLLLEPKMVLAAVLIALGIGMIPGGWTATTVEAETDVEMVRQSLHLDVFAARSFLPAQEEAVHHKED